MRFPLQHYECLLFHTPVFVDRKFCRNMTAYIKGLGYISLGFSQAITLISSL